MLLAKTFTPSKREAALYPRNPVNGCLSGMPYILPHPTGLPISVWVVGMDLWDPGGHQHCR